MQHFSTGNTNSGDATATDGRHARKSMIIIIRQSQQAVSMLAPTVHGRGTARRLVMYATEVLPRPTR